MIKMLTLAAGLLAAASSAVAAPTFEARRGLNMDIWVTWPGVERWGDRDALLPFPEWRRTVDAKALDALRADGFDYVRIPIDPAPFLAAQSEPFRDELYASVLQTVRDVNAAGLNVIVDLHTFARSDDPAIGVEGILGSEATFDAYLDVVRRMARTINQDDPKRVALELMNEPSAECTPDGPWAESLQRLFAAARSSAIRTTLVLSGACGGGAEGLVAVDPTRIPDDNILWSFHSYQPFLLTHQGAMWAGDFIRYVTGLSYPPHDMPAERRNAVLEEIRQRIRAEAPWSRRSGMLAYLDEQFALVDTPEKLKASVAAPFDQVDAWAKRYGIDPKSIILGEFGMIRQEYENPSIVPPASRAAYVRDMIAIAEERGHPWAIWGYGGAFGVVETFDGQRAEPEVLDVVRGLAR